MNANGTIRRLLHDDLVVNLFPASELEGGPANIFLRRLGERVEWTPLLGPQSGTSVARGAQRFTATGAWRGVRFRVGFVPAADALAWFWHVRLENAGDAPVTLDLIHVQDLGLALYAAIRTNEYYTSHYLDHTPLAHARRGWCVATRQNLAAAGRHPWIVIGSLGEGVSFATDALDVYGLGWRAGEAPEGIAAPRLPGRRRQHEHAMVAIQDAAVRLEPGEHVDRGFFAWLEADHPAPTAPADLGLVDRALALREAVPPADDGAGDGAPAAATLFAPLRMLACRDLREEEIARLWPGARRHLERRDGACESFFTGRRTHVVLRAKERRVLRPHGQILRTGNRLRPEEDSLTTTVWMAGVFNALLTQGHVGINRILSTTRSYLGLQRAHGQRIFVDVGGEWLLLDLPSAWEITPSAGRWLYAHAGGLLEVRTVVPTSRHEILLELAVLEGPPVRWLVANHVAWNGDDGLDARPSAPEMVPDGVLLRPLPETEIGRRFPSGWFRIDAVDPGIVATVASDERLFHDGRSRGLPWVVVELRPTPRARLRLRAGLVPTNGAARPDPDGEDDERFWTLATGPCRLDPGRVAASGDDVARLEEFLPWLAHDALVHYLAPRGLEQFSGGGWGTRDVCQGPAELLRALGRWEDLRDLLGRVFAQQNPDGDWPQWFMFFDRERHIRPGDSHGDIVFWPLLALAEYLLATRDFRFLDERVPFFVLESRADAEPAAVAVHVERALGVIRRRVVPGTRLPAYGNGDWNDSLQPADPTMRERLTSTWTAVLHYQTLRRLSAALDAAGRPTAAALDRESEAVRGDLARWLMPDGRLAGFAYFHADGRVDYLLHPRDRATGIRYRLLPMIHAILADLLEPAAAAMHVGLITAHLLGADGARLFDRPPPYAGGAVRHFQRAELSAFFGREIGLMYTHAHLRYAEAMAHYGDADAFFEALRRVNPIGITDLVPAARPRQANCYFSSSDAAVADRREAAERYQDIRAGRVALEGGWRMYSSGAGIALRLVHECLLGLRRGREALGIDPVVPRGLDGLEATVHLEGHPIRVRYRVGERSCGPTEIVLNGTVLSGSPLDNPYRPPGIEVPMAMVRRLLRPDGNRLTVRLG